MLHALFGEGAGGFLVRGSRERLRELAGSVPITPIGTVGGQQLTITLGGDGGDVLGEVAGEALEGIGLEDMGAAHAALAKLFG